MALLVAIALFASLALVGARLVDAAASWRSGAGEPVPGSIGGTAASSELGDVYVVEPGDTLWSIAQRVAPGEDPRPIVHRLAERTGGSALRPGQRVPLAGLR